MSLLIPSWAVARLSCWEPLELLQPQLQLPCELLGAKIRDNFITQVHKPNLMEGNQQQDWVVDDQQMCFQSFKEKLNLSKL